MKMSSEFVRSSPSRGSTASKSASRYVRRYATAQPAGLHSVPKTAICPRIDEALQKEVEHLAVDVGDARRKPCAASSSKPAGSMRREGLDELLDRKRLVRGTPIPLSQRQDRPAGAGDADGLIQLLDRSLEVVVRLEQRVCVEDEQHVGVERARLLLDRRRLADRGGTPDDDDIGAMKLDRTPARARPWRQSCRHRRARCAAAAASAAAPTARQRTMFSCSLRAGMTTSTVASRQSPAGVRTSGVGASQQADGAEQGAGTENEVR